MKTLKFKLIRNFLNLNTGPLSVKEKDMLNKFAIYLISDEGTEFEYLKIQLASCILIDLYSNTIQLQTLIEILNHMKREGSSENPLISRFNYTLKKFKIDSNLKINEEFNFTCFRIDSLKYFIDEKLISSSYSVSLFTNKFDPSSRALLINETKNKLKKRKLFITKKLEKPESSDFYWLTTKQCFLDICNKSKNQSLDLANYLGLTHFAEKRLSDLPILYIDLSDIKFQSQKPNFTNINWLKSNGFLSFKEVEFGRTVEVESCTNSKFTKERVCRKEIDIDLKTNKIPIHLATGQIDLHEGSWNRDNIILEAIKRLH